MRLAFSKYILHFKEPAITSRAVMTEKLTYILKLWDEKNPDKFGIGEAALFRGLSCDDIVGYEGKLHQTIENISQGLPTDLTDFPSIQFGLEQAILDYSNGGMGLYFPSEFTEGNKFIRINGLVWMGKIDVMLNRINQKIKQGCKCIKLKIGALNFDDELKMIRSIREKYSSQEVEIRVDANGGFNMDTILPVLEAMRPYDIHSIEQPIPAGNSELMHFIAEVSPIPVALDEELIGINDTQSKVNLLKTISPSYIILKPSLCGGFSGASEWINIAQNMNIGWWVTSALESNIGLSALSQWVATLNNPLCQGLGTGGLYLNNFMPTTHIEGEKLWFNPQSLTTNRQDLSKLKWIE